MDIGTIDKIKGFLVIDYNDDLRNKSLEKFLIIMKTLNSYSLYQLKIP